MCERANLCQVSVGSIGIEGVSVLQMDTESRPSYGGSVTKVALTLEFIAETEPLGDHPSVARLMAENGRLRKRNAQLEIGMKGARQHLGGQGGPGDIESPNDEQT